MLIHLLAQSQTNTPDLYATQEESLIYLYLIIFMLGMAVLMVIGLLMSWRRHNQRQREIELSREERDVEVPRPDAWATSAQRMEPEDVGPDEAHISGMPEEDDPDDTQRPDDFDPDEDDGDDFPFDTGDDDDDSDGPIGRA